MVTLPENGRNIVKNQQILLFEILSKHYSIHMPFLNTVQILHIRTSVPTTHSPSNVLLRLKLCKYTVVIFALL